MTQAAGRATWYLIASAVSLALPVLTLPVLTRRLTPEAFGILALAQVAATLFRGLANLGVNLGVEREFFEYEGDRRRLGALLRTAFLLLAIGAAGCAVAFLACGGWLAWAFAGMAGWGWFVAAICGTAASGMPVLVWLTYLRNAGRVGDYCRFSIGGALLQSALAITLVVSTGLGLWGVAIGQLVGQSVTMLCCLRQSARELPGRWDGAMARDLLRIGVPVTPKAVLAVMETGLGRVLVKWLHSLGQVGVFGIASSVGNGVFAFLTGLEHVYIPQVYRVLFRGGTQAGSRVGASLTPYCFVSLGLPLLVTLFADEGVRLLTTPAFYDVRYPAALFAVYYGQMFFGKIVGAQLIYARRTWYGAAFGLPALALHAGLALWWIPRHGALGATLAVCASGVVVDAAKFWLAQRLCPIVYEARRVVPMLSLLYGGLLWAFLPRWVAWPYGVWLAGKLALAGVFLLLGFWGRWPLVRAAAEPAPVVPLTLAGCGAADRARRGLTT